MMNSPQGTPPPAPSNITEIRPRNEQQTPQPQQSSDMMKAILIAGLVLGGVALLMLLISVLTEEEKPTKTRKRRRVETQTEEEDEGEEEDEEEDPESIGRTARPNRGRKSGQRSTPLPSVVNVYTRGEPGHQQSGNTNGNSGGQQ